MRSESSRVVICNISIRCRSCGVSTRRCERLVVSLTDINLISNQPVELPGFAIADNRGEIITYRALIAHLHTELFPEVKPSHFRVFCQVARHARSKNLSFSHDISSIRNAESLADIMVGDKDTNSATAQ